MDDTALQLIDDNQPLSRQEVSRYATTIARNLSDAGVRCGYRVAISAQISRETVLLIFGMLRAGVVFLPLNPKLPISVQREYVETFGCTYVLGGSGVSASFPHQQKWLIRWTSSNIYHHSLCLKL
mgnify:CR=1 FL=1